VKLAGVLISGYAPRSARVCAGYKFLPGYQARLRAFGAIPIDATQSLGQVVRAILSRTLAGSATSQASKPGNQTGSPVRPQDRGGSAHGTHGRRDRPAS